MNIKDLLESHKAGNRDFSKADLTGADLGWIDLSGSNFEDADFYGAKLSGANLSQANLSGKTNLAFADLSRANLSGANLRGANLEGANLDETVLQGATYNEKTRFPSGFDPTNSGAISFTVHQGNTATKAVAPRSDAEHTPAKTQVDQPAVSPTIPVSGSSTPTQQHPPQPAPQTSQANRSIPLLLGIGTGVLLTLIGILALEVTRSPIDSQNVATTTTPTTPNSPNAASSENSRVEQEQIEPEPTPVPTSSYESEYSPSSTETFESTPTTTPESVDEVDVSFPQYSCGDTQGSEWWPVFIDGGDVDAIRQNYCRDAYPTTRKNTGIDSVQVASFNSRERADYFAQRVGGEVGQVTYKEAW